MTSPKVRRAARPATLVALAAVVPLRSADAPRGAREVGSGRQRRLPDRRAQPEPRDALSTLLATVVGVPIGLLAGYLGGPRADVVAATPTELAVVNPPEPAHQRGV